jgi:hypothetical protein
MWWRQSQIELVKDPLWASHRLQGRPWQSEACVSFLLHTISLSSLVFALGQECKADLPLSSTFSQFLVTNSFSSLLFGCSVRFPVYFTESIATVYLLALSKRNPLSVFAAWFTEIFSGSAKDESFFYFFQNPDSSQAWLNRSRKTTPLATASAAYYSCRNHVIDNMSELKSDCSV